LRTSRRGRLLTTIGALGLLLAGMTVVVGPAAADSHKLVGEPIPEDRLPALVAAAQSCPTLTPPRLAGQLMALSLAGDAVMSGPDWDTWKPSTEARATDWNATVLALAHQACDLSGTIRAAGFGGNRWKLVVAAQHAGLDAVVEAGGTVPQAEEQFVEQASAYAAWYAASDQFSADEIEETAGAEPSAGPVIKVPENLVAAIKAAGGVCPAATPARIAAQLRAASRFNPDLRTDTGQGMAQFSDALWTQYASQEQSVWDPEDAISVLGVAMCDLSNQFSGFAATDPYTLALGAFQWGPDVIRRAGGLPRSTVTPFSSVVESYVPVYAKDDRLTGGWETPEPVPPVQPSAPPASVPPTKPTVPVPPAATTTTVPPVAGPPVPATTTPSAPPTFNQAKVYRIENVWAKAWISLSDKSVKAGHRIRLMDGSKPVNVGGWQILPAPVAGYVTITNWSTRTSLGVEQSAKGNYAFLASQVTNHKDPNQQWKLTPAGNGEFWITNRRSGRVMELHGDDVKPPAAGWNGHLVDQFDRQPKAKDQRWRITDRGYFK
jgi:hypothetical protein